MASAKRVFLIGGSAAYTALAGAFVTAAGGHDAKIALLLQGGATGIFIGGGHTPTYHRLYATEPVRGVIRERYEERIPVAGVSAGALIALDPCVLTPDETGEATNRT
jgi:cyanophycinase-like exopeptidase